MAKTVTLKDGSILTGEAAKNYGKGVIALNKLNTNATPAEVPVVPPSTEPQALEAAVKGTQDAYTTQGLAAKAEASKTQEQSLFEQFLSSTINAPTEAGLTATEYAKKGGVDELTPQLSELNSQITAEAEALRTQTKELMKNTAGLESRALTEEANRLRTESLDRQAALAVTQLSLQGRYDSAKEIADRAVAARFAEGQRKLDVLGLAYQRTKDIFTKDEQRAFETAQADRQNKLEMENFKEKTKYEQMIKQSDPLYRAQYKKILNELNTGNVTITNPQAGRFAGALGTILASGKFTKDQQASLVAGINTGEDPLAIVRNQAKNIMGSEQSNKVDNLETANSQLSRIDSLLQDYYAAGGKSGIFTGNYETTLNKLGEVNDPKLVSAATELAVAMQAYRLAVTGTASSVKEDARIELIFPGITSSEGLNKAKSTALQNSFQEQIDQKYRNVLGNGYDQLKTAEEAGVKGASSDKDFVSNTLTSVGASYEEALGKVPPGYIGVVNNKTGEIQAVEPGEFDPKLYTKL